MKIKLNKNQWEQIGKTTGWIKEAHHGNEYPKEIMNMSLMKFLDKLEKSPNPKLKQAYHSIEKSLDGIVDLL